MQQSVTVREYNKQTAQQTEHQSCHLAALPRIDPLELSIQNLHAEYS